MLYKDTGIPFLSSGHGMKVFVKFSFWIAAYYKRVTDNLLTITDLTPSLNKLILLQLLSKVKQFTSYYKSFTVTK